MHRRHLMALGATLAGLSFPRSALRAAMPAGGDKPGQVVRTHALSLLGEPALPAGFSHWPWVNPAAPKGGEVTLTALGLSLIHI